MVITDRNTPLESSVHFVRGSVWFSRGVRTGVCWGNNAAEAFFGTLKHELANRRRWKTRTHAHQDLVR